MAQPLDFLLPVEKHDAAFVLQLPPLTVDEAAQNTGAAHQAGGQPAEPAPHRAPKTRKRAAEEDAAAAAAAAAGAAAAEEATDDVEA